MNRTRFQLGFEDGASAAASLVAPAGAKARVCWQGALDRLPGRPAYASAEELAEWLGKVSKYSGASLARLPDS